MDIKPIKREVDYERALRRVEELWDSPEGSAESDELDILTTLIEAYEREHYPIDLPDPIEAIKFRLEQTGKDSRALIGVIGQQTRVYEVLRGKRPLSLKMIISRSISLLQTAPLPIRFVSSQASKSGARL